jgi:hypothetical protein
MGVTMPLRGAEGTHREAGMMMPLRGAEGTHTAAGMMMPLKGAEGTHATGETPAEMARADVPDPRTAASESAHPQPGGPDREDDSWDKEARENELRRNPTRGARMAGQYSFLAVSDLAMDAFGAIEDVDLPLKVCVARTSGRAADRRGSMADGSVGWSASERQEAWRRDDEVCAADGAWSNAEVKLRGRAFAAVVLAYRMSLKAGLTHADDAKREKCTRAVRDEIGNLMGMKALKVVPLAKLSPRILGRRIPSHMFLKEKVKADGSFDKVKGRLVAGGNHVDSSTVGTTAAPTVNSITVMTAINLAAIEGAGMRTHDVKGAYLIPDIDPGEEATFIKVERTLATIMVEMHPELAVHVDATGALTFMLLKYLYGLPQAAFHFNAHLTASMLRMGFRVTEADRCCFVRGSGRTRIIVTAHVDDLLVVGGSRELDAFETQLSKAYEINTQRGALSYIGLDIRLDGDDILVSQSGYRLELLDRFSVDMKNLRRSVTTPTDRDLMKARPETDKLANQPHYLSMVMSLMYIARLTRPDILLAVTYLATRCTRPTMTDMYHATHVLRYLASVPNMVVRYRGGPGRTMTLSLQSDASHACHEDGRGHAGMFISLGSGFVACRATKIRMVTLSSTESEGVGVSETMTYVVWMRVLLRGFGYAMSSPTPVYQDNLSTIWMARHDGSFARTKHIVVRKYYVRERLEANEAVLIHRAGDQLGADMLTKVLDAKAATRHMKSVGMEPEPRSEPG